MKQTLISIVFLLVGISLSRAQVINESVMDVSTGTIVSVGSNFTSTAGTVNNLGVFVARGSFNVAANYLVGVNATDTLIVAGYAGAPQVIASPLIVNNLMMQSSVGQGAASIGGNGEVSVSNSLWLNNGILSVAGAKFSISDTAKIYGGSDSSYIDGGVKAVTTTPTGTPFVFNAPVGKKGFYRPMKFQVANTQAATLGVQYFYDNPIANFGPLLNPSITVVDSTEYWEMLAAMKTDVKLTVAARNGVTNLALMNQPSDDWVILGYTSWGPGGDWVVLKTTYNASTSELTADIPAYPAGDYYPILTIGRQLHTEHLRFNIDKDTIMGSTSLSDALVTIKTVDGLPATRDLRFKVDYKLGTAAGIKYANANDYSLRGGIPASTYGSDTITIAAGENTSAPVNLNAMLTRIIVGNQRLILVATPLNPAVDSFAVGNDRDSVMILDGDARPGTDGGADLGIKLVPYRDLGLGVPTVKEGDSVRIIVGLTRADSVRGRNIALNVSPYPVAANGNMGAGQLDYKIFTLAGLDVTTITSGNPNMIISAGKTADTLLLVALKDNLFEGDEKLRLTAKILGANTVGDALAPASDTLTILDAEWNAKISITKQNTQVDEGQKIWIKASLPAGITTQDSIKIDLDAPASGSDVMVDSIVKDFNIYTHNPALTAITKQLIIPRGKNSDSVWFAAHTDQLAEDDEHVWVNVSRTLNPAVDTTQVVLIKDMNKPRSILLKHSSDTIREGQQGYVFMELQGGLKAGKEIVAGLTPYNNGKINNATYMDDYVLQTSGSASELTIKPGASRSDTIWVDVLYDNLYEPFESILIDTTFLNDHSFQLTPVMDTVWIQNVDTTGGIISDTTKFTFNIVKDSIYHSESTVARISLPKGMVATDTVKFTLAHLAASTAVVGTDYVMPNNIMIEPFTNNGAYGEAPIKALVNPASTTNKFLYALASSEKVFQRVVHPLDTLKIVPVDGVKLVIDTTQVREGKSTNIYAIVEMGVGFDTTIYIDLTGAGTPGALHPASANDFSLTKTRLTLKPRANRSDTIVFTAQNDHLYEPTEQLDITGVLKKVTGVSPKLINNPLTVNILDYDQVGATDTTHFQMHIAKKNLLEGENTYIWFTLPNARTVQDNTLFDVTQNSNATGAIAIKDVDFDFGGKPYPATLKIAAGKAISDSILFRAFYDNIYERLEYVKIDGHLNDLSSNDAFAQVANSPDSIFIHNVDTTSVPPLVDSIYLLGTLSRDTLNGLDTVYLTVKLPGTTTLAKNGSALQLRVDKVAGTIKTKAEVYPSTNYDLQLQNDGIVTIPAGSNSATIAAYSLSDNWLGVLEWAKFTLTPLNNEKVKVTLPQDTIYLKDGDVAKNKTVLKLHTISPTVVEGGKTGVYVELLNNRQAGQAMSISLTHPNGGTAILGGSNADYTLGNLLTIPNAATSSDTIYLQALLDQVKEPNKTVNIIATWDAYKEARFDSTATVTIIDTAVLNVKLTLSAHSVMEGNGVTVTASYLNGMTNSNPYNVKLNELAGSTANYPLDYTLSNTVITIPANQASGSVNLFAIDDGIFEGQQQVIFQGTHGTASTTNIDTLYIQDAQSNATGGADVSFMLLPSDTVKEGDSVRLVARLMHANTTKAPIAITLAHPAGGDALLNTDYSFSKRQLNIVAGKGADSLWIKAKIDGLIEGFEFLNINGTIGGTNNVLIPATQRLTIRDKETDDMPYNITITTSQDTVTEGDSIWVVASLPKGIRTAHPIIVNLNSMTGTATYGVDYTLNNTITIPSNNNRDSIRLVAKKDGIAEGFETVIIDGTVPTGFHLAGTPKTVVIRDLESNAKGGVNVKLSVPITTFIEGEKGMVILSFVDSKVTSNRDVAINLTHPIAPISATLVDYSLPNTMVIPAGHHADTVWFVAKQDSLLELDEYVHLKSTVVAPADSILASTAAFTFTIQDYYNAINPLNLNIRQSKDTLTEHSDELWIYASLPDTMKTDYPIVINIDQPLPNSTATNLDDYIFAKNTITIKKGETKDSVRVVSVPDNIYEGWEHVTYQASVANTELHIPDPLHTFYIMDAQANEKGGANLLFDIDSASMHEANTSGYAAGTISIEGASSAQNDIQFKVNYLGDKASLADFTLLASAISGPFTVIPDSTVMTLPAGDNNVRFRIKMIQDNIIEGDEWLRLGITPLLATDSAVAGKSIDTLLIIDKDARNPQGGADLQFRMEKKQLLEGTSMKIFVNFTNGRVADRMVQVRLDTMGVLPHPATGGGVDYTISGLVNNLLTIPAGAKGDTLIFSALRDYLYEGDERASLEVQPFNSVLDSFVSITKDTVTIIDADALNGGLPLILSQEKDSVGEGDSIWIAVNIKPDTVAGVVHVVRTQDSVSVILKRLVSSTAIKADYDLDTILWIAPGQTGDTIWLKALTDNVAESTEYLNLQAVGGSGYDVQLNPDQLSVAITDSTLNRNLVFYTTGDTIKEGESSYVYMEMAGNVVADQHSVALTFMRPPGGTATPGFIDYNVDPNASGNNYTLTIAPNHSRSDSLKINALFDDVYDPFETIVLNKDSLTNKTFSLDTLPHTLWIQDMDTTTGVPGVDTLHITFSNDAVNDTIFQGEEVIIRASLPGVMVPANDLKIAIHPRYDASNMAPLGSGYATKGSDFNLPDTLVIKKGENYGEITLYSIIHPHNPSYPLDSIKIAPFSASIADPFIQFDSVPDSIYIVDASVVLLQVDTNQVREGDSVAVWAIANTPFPRTQVQITLRYDSIKSKARYNDYTLPDSVITLDSASSKSNVIYIHANTDNIYETIERLTFNGITVYNGTGGHPVVAGLPIKIDIHDVDNTTGKDTTYLTMHTDTTRLYEGDSMHFWVTLPAGRIAGDSVPISLQHPVGNSTADPSDYTLGKMMWIYPGNNSSNSLTLHALEDNIFEFPENVIVNGTLANPKALILANNPDTITILNLDTTQVVPLKDSIDITVSTSAMNKTIVKGNSETITLSLPGTTVTAEDLYFTINKIGSSVISPMSYPSTVVIPAGQHSGSVQVDALLDNLVSGVEDFIYNVVPDSAQLRMRHVPDTLFVVDQDLFNGNPVVQLNVSATEMNEGDTAYVYASLKDGKLAGTTLQIDLSHPGLGIAQNNLDYTLDSVLTFLPNAATTNTLKLVALHDLVIEPDENLIITAHSSAFPDSLIDASPVEVMIKDQTPLSGITLSVSRDSVLEGDSVWVIANLGNVTTDVDILVTLSQISGDASDTDYDLPTTLLIKANTTRDSVRFYAKKDSLWEGFEHAIIQGTLVDRDGSNLELQNSPVNITIIDANANASGGALITVDIPQDSVMEGNTIPVIVRLGGINKLSTPVRGTIIHPYVGSEADSSDYLLRNNFIIPRNQIADTLYLHAIKDFKIEKDEKLYLYTQPQYNFDSVPEPLDSVVILDFDSRNGPYNISLSLSSDSVWEGDNVFVTASLPDSISTQIPITVLLKHPLASSTAGVLDYAVYDTLVIDSDENNNSVPLYALIDHKYEGTEQLVIGARVNDTLYQIIDTPLVLSILDIDANDIINANNFSWRQDNLLNLDDDAARNASGVNGQFFDGTPIDPYGFVVDTLQMATIHAEGIDSLYDLTFYTPSGKPDSVKVLLTDADSVHFDSTTDEVIHASNFVWKLSDCANLSDSAAISMAVAKAFETINNQGISVLTDASVLRNATVAGLYPLVFNTMKNTRVTIHIMLTANDSTIVVPTTGEVISANHFAWTIAGLSALTNPVLAAHANAFNINTADSVEVMAVDSMMQQIYAQTSPVSMPLTFYTALGSEITISVAITGNDTTSFYGGGNTLGADFVLWHLDSAASFNSSVAPDTSHATATENGVFVTDSSRLIADSAHVADIQTTTIKAVMPLALYLDTVGGNSVLTKVILTTNDHNTISQTAKEAMGADHFAWNIAELNQLNDASARVKSDVTLYDLLSDTLISITHLLPSDFSNIWSVTTPSVRDLVYTSDRGTQDTVEVVLNYNDTTTINHHYEEAIGASHFMVRLDELPQLTKRGPNSVFSRSLVTAFDLTTKHRIPESALLLDSLQYVNLKSFTTAGQTPLTFSTPQGTSVVVNVDILINDTVTIINGTQSIGADYFSWKLVQSGALTDVISKDASNVIAFKDRSANITFPRDSVVVEQTQLQAIQSASVNGMYPLTFIAHPTGMAADSVTIMVMLTDNDTTEIDPDLKESIGGNHFAWSYTHAADLTDAQAHVSGKVVAYSFVDPNNVTEIPSSCDALELDAIQHAVYGIGVYPLTFSTALETSVTIYVTLTDNDTTTIDPIKKESINANSFVFLFNDRALLNNMSAMQLANATAWDFNNFPARSIVSPELFGNTLDLAAINHATTAGPYPLHFSTALGTTVLVHVILTDADTTVINPVDGETMSANDFSWSYTDRTLLDETSAATSARVEAYDFDGNTLTPVFVDNNLAALYQAPKPGVYPLTFLSNTYLSSVTVAVLLTDNDHDTIDHHNQEAIMANNFGWKLSNAANLSAQASKQLSEVKAFDYSNGASDSISVNTITANSSELDSIRQHVNGEGAYCLTFSTLKGTSVPVHVVLSDDSAVISTSEYILANNFGITTNEAQALTSLQAQQLADVRGEYFTSNTVTPFVLGDFYVNQEQLDSITSLSHGLGIYPLSYTTPTGNSTITINVTLYSNRAADSLFVNVAISIPPGTGCAYSESCEEDKDYTLARYFGVDTMKNLVTINVSVLESMIANDSTVAQVSYVQSKDSLTGTYSSSPLVLYRDPLNKYKSVGILTIERLDTLPDIEGSLNVYIHALGLQDSVHLVFSNDFDHDGFSNAMERTTCIKTTDGVYNEWYYHAPDGDADYDGISNLVEAGNVWDNLYLKDDNKNCTPNFLDKDSNGNGIPDDVEKYIPDTTNNKGIWVTQALSPNRDGIGNERMYIGNMPANTDVQVVLFSRVGRVIYKEAKYNNKDRAFAGYPNQGGNSKLVPMGTYYYYISYVDPKTKAKKEYSGFVEVRY